MNHTHLKLHFFLESWVLSQRSLGLVWGGAVWGFCPFGDWQTNHDALFPKQWSEPHRKKNPVAIVCEVENIRVFFLLVNV